MISIFLCEDNKQQLASWKKWIEKYLLMQDQDIKLAAAAVSPYELLEKLYRRKRASRDTGIYFLDIDFKSEINGFQLAQQIRKKDPRGYIVFVTTHGEAAFLTYQYKVEALDFIIKDEPEKMEQRFAECIDAAVNNHMGYLSSSEQLICLKSDKTNIYVNQDDILYIQSDASRRLSVCMAGEVKRISGTLKSVMVGLNPDFCYCSQSAIVNTAHVKEFRKKERLLIMDNGETLEVSVRMKKEIERKLEGKPES